MRRFFVVFVVVLAAAVAYRSMGSPETGTGSLTLPGPAPNVGESVPGFTAETVDGETFKLSDEGVYVLTFWSTLNQGAARARPGFERLSQEYGDSGASFAAVYVSNTPELERDAPYTVLRDPTGKLTSLYNVKHVPRLFLIRNGTVKLVQNGYYEENERHLRQTLEEVLPEKA